MAEHPGSHTPTAKDFSDLFPGAGGALLKGSGLADRLTKDIASQSQPPRGFIAAGRQVLQDSGRLNNLPPPVPTRGIDGPPAVNTGIQNTPAPVTQLQDNPSGVSGTPQIPVTPVSPDVVSPPPQVPLAGQVGLANRKIPGAGSTGSPLNDELRRRLKKSVQQF